MMYDMSAVDASIAAYQAQQAQALQAA